MALSINSTLREILAEEQGKAVVEKHLPGMSSNPQLQMARGMSLKEIASHAQGQITAEILTAIDEDLGKI